MLSLANKFKIRCSAIGQIMTNPRSKSETLSKTAKTYCETWLKEQLYNRKHEIRSKYLTKGIEAEQDSIELLGRHMDKMLIKNEQHESNDYMTGTPDIVLSNSIIDVKSSWDCFTFPKFETEIDKNYEWQLQGYMELFDKGRAMLVYCLVDTPEDLIDREIRYQFDDEIIDVEKYEEARQRYIYSDLPDSMRIKTFHVGRDQSKADAIRERVDLCREYIDSLINNI